MVGVLIVVTYNFEGRVDQPVIQIQAEQSEALHLTDRPVPVTDVLSRTAYRFLNQTEYYKRRETKVNEFKHRVINGPTHGPICLNDTLVIVLVNSHPGYFDKRLSIRQTWGQPIQSPLQVTWPNNPNCCSRMRLFFVLGLSQEHEDAVREEQLKYGDVLQGDFIDDYHNMTLKSLLGLKIVSESCPGVRYLLKSDDDMFINVPFLLQRLESLQLKRAIFGPLIRHGKPKRNGKWKITNKDFPFETFPPYMTGSAYVITNDIVPLLLETSHYVPYLFIDDLYITGILGQIIQVRRVGGRNHEEFAYAPSKPTKLCAVVNNAIITSTRMTPNRLAGLWNKLKSVRHDGDRKKCRLK